MKVHLFYPQNDLALAAGTPHFTAPRVAQELKLSGEVLPLWYAAQGDKFITQGVNAAWYDRVTSEFGLDVDVFDGNAQGCNAVPWGWSAASRQLLMYNGFEKEQLPNDEQLERLRTLSHRRISREISERIKVLTNFETAPSAIEVNDITQVKEQMDRLGDIVVKTPWSSSGRGVFDSVSMGREELLRQTAGLIRRNGSVMVEQRLNRVEDFAMLFESDNNGVHFTGYSLFTADSHGTYEGNILMSDEMIVQRLSAHIEREQLDTVRMNLETILTDLIGDAYIGPLGIDMVVAEQTDGEKILAPAIEMNLRRTMGHVAHRIANDILGEGKTGRFTIVPSDKSEHGYTVRDKRLTSGTLNLVPPGGKFSFLVEVD